MITLLAGSGATVTSTRSGSAIVAGLSAERIAALMTRHGLPLDELTPHQPSLEEAYLQMTRSLVDFRAQDSTEDR
jgi:ABC-2 type transport system ATP-binding protein